MASLFNLSFGKKKHLKVLIIEDNEDDSILLIHQLQRNGYTVQHQRVDTANALEQALRQSWDIVLADYSMPNMSGMDALMRVRSKNPDVPFIFVSGTIGEELAVEAIRMGAQDYVLKDKLNRLPVVVRREIQDSRARKERRKAEQQINYLARYDGMTGLPNRFTLLEYLKDLIDRHGAGKHIILVLHIRLERLKSIHDSVDHETGIQFLQEVSNRLQQFILDQGVIARLSNHEFALVHTGFSSENALKPVLASLSDILAKPYVLDSMPVYCGARIGAVVYPGGAFEASDMLRKAEVAALNGTSSNGIAFFEERMANQLEDRVVLQRCLREALEKKEFTLTFQPQVNMADGNIVSVEAFVEWHNTERGLIHSDVFLPLAEETGFIFLLGEWVIRQVCQQIKLWEYGGILSPCVAIPIAARQFQEDNLVELLSQMLTEYDLSPSSLRLEITESAIMRNSERAALVLRQIKQTGTHVVLENFGGNYSNLAYLKDFVSDFITIGPDFVQSLDKIPSSRETVASTIALAHKLGIKTIAKGVENATQYAALKTCGCNLAQGSFIGGTLEPWVMREKLRSDRGHVNL